MQNPPKRYSTKKTRRIPSIVEPEESYFPSEFVKISDVNTLRRPMSQKQRSIVQRLHEGYNGRST